VRSALRWLVASARVEIALVLLATLWLVVILIPDTLATARYLKYILTFAMTTVLLGFAIVNAAFVRVDVSVIERIGMSIGITMAIVPLVGLVLNFTPLKLYPSSIGGATFVVVLVCVAVSLWQRARRQSEKSSDKQGSNVGPTQPPEVTT
jgi:uncharacterized membrane protein